MKLNRLHFHPINGRALDIITAILHTEEVGRGDRARRQSHHVALP